MLEGRDGGPLGLQVGGRLDELRGSLERLEESFAGEHQKKTLARIAETVALARRDCNGILAELRQRIAVRSILADMPPGALHAAMGGPPASGARLCLAVARAFEATGEEGPLGACLSWEEFRRAAVREAWFPDKGPEVALLYLHMAELADDIFEEERAMAHSTTLASARQELAEGLDPAFADMSFLWPEWLYETACSLDPRAEWFEKWLAWSREEEGPKGAEKVANAWHRSLPDDPRPLLLLMEYAESRNSLKKALGYLARAEALDGLNPQVRRARPRLHIQCAIRQLRQRKPRLALRELEALAKVPQANEGDRPAFAASLRSLACRAAGDAPGAEEAAREVARILGSDRAANIALAAAGSLVGMEASLPRDGGKQGGGWVEAIGRVNAMVHDFGYRVRVPDDLKSAVEWEFRDGVAASEAVIEAAGKAALVQGWNEVAFLASAAGFKKGHEGEPRFLMLRAQALPDWEEERRDACLAAAIALARQRQDTALTAEAVELRRRYSSFYDLGMAGPEDELTPKGLIRVLEFERNAKLPPTKVTRGWEEDGYRPARRPRRRRKKARFVPPEQGALF